MQLETRKVSTLFLQILGVGRTMSGQGGARRVMIQGVEGGMSPGEVYWSLSRGRMMDLAA